MGDIETGWVDELYIDVAATCVVPRSRGGWVASGADALYTVGAAGDTRRIVEFEHSGRGMRMNDGKCDREGRLWIGSMDPLDGNGGVLYRIDPDWSVHEMVAGLGISNGLDWSPDGQLMYLVDTPTQRIDVFDFDGQTGTLQNRRVFADVPTEFGLPDGLTVDAEGYVWLAMWGGSRIVRFDRGGRVVRQVELPAQQITSCSFGDGQQVDWLFVTSAADGLQTTPGSAEGNVFVIEPGVNGLGTSTFRG